MSTKELDDQIDFACDELPEGIRDACKKNMREHMSYILERAGECDYGLMQNGVLGWGLETDWLEKCPAGFFDKGRPAEKDKAIDSKFAALQMILATEIMRVFNKNCSCKITSW